MVVGCFVAAFQSFAMIDDHGRAMVVVSRVDSRCVRFVDLY
jgi:hypothetical protein